VVDEIIREPFGGAHRDWGSTFEAVGKAIDRNLGELLRVPIQELTERRYQKFRKMGIFDE
jgi:acetyl-CoA carboxylase carboxyl transferase subunit alpha